MYSIPYLSPSLPSGYWASAAKYECCSSSVPEGDYLEASECVVGSQSSPGNRSPSPSLYLSLFSVNSSLILFSHPTHYAMQSTGHDFDSIFPCSASPPPSQMTGPSFVSCVCVPGAMDELGGKVIKIGASPPTIFTGFYLSLFTCSHLLPTHISLSSLPYNVST